MEMLPLDIAIAPGPLPAEQPVNVEEVMLGVTPEE